MQKISEIPHLILASQSPRRSYLLRKAGLEFTVIPSAIDEGAIPPAAAEVYVRQLALAKAEDIAARYPQSWVIGADTIVLIDDSILGKPACGEDARRMLMRLSGQTHRVLTGYAIVCQNKMHRFVDMVSTEVQFKTLSAVEIEWYIRTKEPFDKAGAYAIQGLGTFLVKRINGSYTNVVGLPVCEVIEHLIQHGIVTMEQHPDRPMLKGACP